MIQDSEQYQKALEELLYMEEWLGRLQSEERGTEKGLTKAGIRKMIARLQDELAVYEGQQEISAALAAR